MTRADSPKRGGAAKPVPGLIKTPTGIRALDAMLAGGYFRGSGVLISGSAGSGKTTIGAQFLDRTCLGGGRASLFALEEAPAQIVRNMRSIGIDLQPWLDKDRLRIVATRPGCYGLEEHLVAIYNAIAEFQPDIAVIDPVSSMETLGSLSQGKSMVMRTLDVLRPLGVTMVLTNLVKGGDPDEQTHIQVSSIIDTWICLRDVENNGERDRTMHIIKSRGVAHSNQVREFLLTESGIELRPVYAGPAGILVGTARVVQEVQDEDVAGERGQEAERLARRIERERARMEARIAAQRAEFEITADELEAAMERVRSASAQADTIAERSRAERGGAVRRRGRGAA